MRHSVISLVPGWPMNARLAASSESGGIDRVGNPTGPDFIQLIASLMLGRWHPEFHDASCWMFCSPIERVISSGPPSGVIDG
jgi:hypothetical protein